MGLSLTCVGPWVLLWVWESLYGSGGPAMGLSVHLWVQGSSYGSVGPAMGLGVPLWVRGSRYGSGGLSVGLSPTRVGPAVGVTPPRPPHSC